MEAESRHRLQALLEAWYEAIEAGQEPRLEAICADDLELMPLLARVVAGETEAAHALGALGDDLGTREFPAGRLGEFRILARIGEGGMGRVFLARQESLGRTVALKVLHERAASDPRQRLRFRREAEIAAAIDHSGIVPVYAVGEDKGFFYIAMKVLSGPSFDELPATLTPRRTAEIGAALARALDAAHRSGIVHRDIKPANVMMDGPVPCLLDFGLARARTDVTITRRGTIPGTLLYMSPEQLRGEAPLDARSDIYSLGATLYEALSGRPPFDDEDVEVLMRSILTKAVPRLGLPSRSRDLETILLRALDQEPARRFASAGTLAEDLEAFLEGRPIASRPTGPLARVAKLARRHRGATTALGALLVVTVGFLIVLAVQRVRAHDQRVREIAAVGELLEVANVSAAAPMVASLSARFPGCDEVRELHRRLGQLEVLEDLMDAVQDRKDAQDGQRLDELLAGLDPQAFASWDPRRARLASMARIVACAHLDRTDEAREGLQLLAGDPGCGRALAALGAVVANEAPSELPPVPVDAGSALADERVITALAMRMAGSPRAARRDEIEAALAEDGAHYRARVAWAVYLAESPDRGEARAALEALRGLVRHGEHRRVVRRNLARQRMLLGDLARARETLVAMRVSPGWTAAEFELWCDILVRERDDASLRSTLSEALGRWPRNGPLLLKAAHLANLRGDLTEARRLVERAARDAAMRRDRERATAFRLVLRLRGLGHADVTRPLSSVEGEARSRLEELLTDARGALRGVRDHRARSDVALTLAQTLRLLGRLKRAARALDLALRADPEHTLPRLQFAAEVVSRLQIASRLGRENPEEVTATGPVMKRLGAARSHVRFVCDAERRGAIAASEAQGDLAWFLRAYLARAGSDRAAGLQAARVALERTPEAERGKRQVLQAIVTWAADPE